MTEALAALQGIGRKAVRTAVRMVGRTVVLAVRFQAVLMAVPTVLLPAGLGLAPMAAMVDQTAVLVAEDHVAGR